MKLRVRLFLAYAAATLAFVAQGAAWATPSLVMDVASGQLLQKDQPTHSWYPASLTKLMTVYVALEAVRQHRISLDTPIVISPRATRVAPSKMGFRPGSEVTLRNALVMLMVKSANDIAIAVAEGVSGSVEAFAEEMNQASANLGMRESHWVNPNGLPDPQQVTSARDLALLARALLLNFPDSAGLYNIGAMQIDDKIIKTHNGMLGRYPGADGMKTGFTCPAGFNLVASATRNGRKLIAVVLGAPSAAARTAKAASLLDRAFQTGSAIGAAGDLPSSGAGPAPDIRESACHNRGRSNEEFLAEVEDMAIPINYTFADGQQAAVSVKDLARLPAVQFEPVRVYVGRAPDYHGPVARARPAGVPVGADADMRAYDSDKAEAATAGAAPILHAASDARSLRAAARAKRAQERAAAKEAAARAEGAKRAVAHAETPQSDAPIRSDKEKAHNGNAYRSAPADAKTLKKNAERAIGGKAVKAHVANADRPATKKKREER